LIAVFFYKPRSLSIFEHRNLQKIKIHMGRGDQKSKKGKISSGSYGVSRKKKKTAAYVAEPEAKKAAPKTEEVTAEKPAAKKAPAKKAATKK
jgi:30S ribosomal protein S31